MNFTYTEEAECRARIGQHFDLREAGRDEEAAEVAADYGRWLVCLAASKLAGRPIADVEIANKLCERALRENRQTFQPAPPPRPPRTAAERAQTVALLRETKLFTEEDWKRHKLRKRLG